MSTTTGIKYARIYADYIDKRNKENSVHELWSGMESVLYLVPPVMQGQQLWRNRALLVDPHKQREEKKMT